MEKKKIAILGGGVGAVTTAFALTSQEDWASRFDITVYQMGFRLGGKGASGRNPAHQDRIEEHGLHIWLGFYENAFRLMRACYDELRRPKTAKLATIEQAFKPQSFISIQEWVDDHFETWNVDFPTNGDVPGTGGAIPRPRDYLAMLLQVFVELVSDTELDLSFERSGDAGALELFELLDALPDAAGLKSRQRISSSALFRSLTSLARGLLDDLQELSLEAVQVLLKPILGVVELWISMVVRPAEEHIKADATLRRAVILLDLGRVIVSGIVADNLLVRGFAAANDEEWSAWLTRHGALELTLSSAPVRAFYDLVFGFPGGDYSKLGDIEAGTALNAFLRLALTYKGAIFWEMQAGMGDTIFAPYYEVLRRRGVRFEFFHKVTNLGLDDARTAIEHVDFDVQATLVDPSRPYEPLVDVKGLPSWPSVPRYEQLVQGRELAARQIDLESSWSAWAAPSRARLIRGVDFDEVVLGISIAALTDIGQELIEAESRFAKMVDAVETVQTMAAQLWLTPDLAGLGWPAEKTVMTAYADALNTWADMSHLLERESWPPAHTPFNIAYFCGPMPDAAIIPPYTDHAFPAREKQRVVDEARRFFSQWTGHLWPNVTREGEPRALDYAYLVDPAGGEGDERLLAQYFRANIDKTERYVLSVTGSSAHRLHPAESGFSNLVLVGDWTRCGLDAGCVEAATISGLLGAEAISGERARVEGHYEIERTERAVRHPSRRAPAPA